MCLLKHEDLIIIIGFFLGSHFPLSSLPFFVVAEKSSFLFGFSSISIGTGLSMAASQLAENLVNDHAHVVSISIFVAVLCLCIVIGHLLEENRWVNESITSILIGCIIGTIILFWSKGTSSHILRFDEELFFIYLLPPIIFNAGFQVKKKQFFRNFFTIMLFGVIGAFISSLIITAGSWWLFPKIGFAGLTAREYLAIGIIFSSTDTVCTLQVLNQNENPLLSSLVFGEGVVNDATIVVLFNAIQKLDISKLDGWTALHVLRDFFYLFSTSTALGIAAGLLTAYFLKALHFGRHSTDREISLMVLTAYLSYMLAELLHLSGILTVFFCGIVMSHYAWHNVTKNSKIATRQTCICDDVVYCRNIHLSLCGHGRSRHGEMENEQVESVTVIFFLLYSFGTSMGIYSIIILLISLGRAAFVFPLSALSNHMHKNAEIIRITFKHQIIIWWAGLMRGAVSIALAFKQFTYSGVTWDPVHATMVTNTIIVVLCSTLVLNLISKWVFLQFQWNIIILMVFGFLTKPLIKLLLPHYGPEPNIPKEDLTLPMLSFEESATTNILRAKNSLSMLMERPIYTIHSYWRKFDNAYMRPTFGGPLSAPSA
ncbi:hypothetical protein HHK36_005745 [Tetracentron sinense]|uniref:Cation/H+ exchanger transmembrane domain-containing protein n=1 Tax=Tetracentron sinense TaxID=13715 RepID=A0A835DN41_TETSI|nr:hypothetical protein HHK36_005745 [Tetracentron sinense]